MVLKVTPEGGAAGGVRAVGGAGGVGGVRAVGGAGAAGGGRAVGGAGAAGRGRAVGGAGGGAGLAGARLLVGATVPVISTPAHLGFALHTRVEYSG